MTKVTFDSCHADTKKTFVLISQGEEETRDEIDLNQSFTNRNKFHANKFHLKLTVPHVMRNDSNLELIVFRISDNLIFLMMNLVFLMMSFSLKMKSRQCWIC